MPQRQEPSDPHTPVATPKGQTLSEQERQDLDAASQGIDKAASALPDDGPPPVPPRAESVAPSKQSSKTPLAHAQQEGLVATPDESGPPLDGQGSR